jgi:hypothetical protein
LKHSKNALRTELLTLHTAGAEQETTSPYLLAFVDQVRRTVDWRNHALQLATKLYGIEKAEQWKLKVEVAGPAQAITQVRVKPNPDYATNLTSRPTKRPVVSIGMPTESLAKSGD